MKTIAWVVLAIVVFWSGVALLTLVLGPLGPIGQFELLLIMLFVGVSEYVVLRRLRQPARVPE